MYFRSLIKKLLLKTTIFLIIVFSTVDLSLIVFYRRVPLKILKKKNPICKKTDILYVSILIKIYRMDKLKI